MQGQPRSELVAHGDVVLEVLVLGTGPTVMCVPSLGRGAEDFDDLAHRVASGGHRVLLPQPRGIGASTGPLDGVSMQDLVGDVARALVACGDPPATIVGHAFGNRIARMLATAHPELVESVVLLACGGLVPPSTAASAALFEVFDTSRSDVEHLEAVRTAFFAPRSDPTAWAGGWHPRVAAAQAIASGATDVADWWGAGSADVLIVQPADDVVAVPENARQLLATLGERGAMVEIADAGHALLPEQPDAVASTLLDWLERRGRG